MTALSCALGALALLAGGCEQRPHPAVADTATVARPSASPSLDLSAMSANDLLSKAKVAATDADSVRIRGTGKDGTESIELDLAFTHSGSSGTIAINSLPITLLNRDGSTWFKATDAFWRAQAGSKAASIIAVVNGRWIKANPADPTYSDFASLADRSELVNQFLTPDGTLSKGGPTTLRGLACITLQGSDGTLYLDASDARPVQLTGSSTDDGDLSFDYSTVSLPPAPDPQDVLDSTTLGG